jgi:predicted DsbA family dithiol-disulfide isomerase
VETETGKELPVTWRYFSLEQNNHSTDPDKKVWEDSTTHTKGINAFRAVEAIRRQSADLFKISHGILLTSFHKEHCDIADAEVLKNIAEKVGADINRFILDFNDPLILDRLAKDHFHAVNDLNIFGTPTFVFNGDNPVFLKIDLSDTENSYDLFKDFIHIAENRKNILEIKRP